MPCYRFLIVVLGLLGSAWAQTSDVDVIDTQNIRIQLTAYDLQLLEETIRKVIKTVEKTDGNVQERTGLQRHLQDSNVLRSAHVNKKSDRLVIKTYRATLHITDPKPGTIDALLKLNLAPGIDVEIALE